MTKLGNLFDFQKVAGNKDLEAVIKDTESRYAVELSDSELELASAGTGANAPGMVEHYCDKCKCKRLFKTASGGRATCTAPGCNNQILL